MLGYSRNRDAYEFWGGVVRALAERRRRICGFGKILCLLLIVAAAVLSGVRGAAAQELSAPERARLEAQKQKLFEQMLRNPANLDATFAYADAAAKLGDYEAAVAALERMLLFNPNLARVQLELGALYFRMGSFEVARAYFEKAAAAHPPPEVRARIEHYLAAIKEAESRSHITGYFFSGVQYQSDANIAPGSALIHSPIGDVLLNSQFIKHSDKNLFANGSFLYTYDLGTQNRDTIDVTGLGFMNHYFRFSRLDLDFGEVTVGPRFNFPRPGLPGVVHASVKPYLITNEVGLGENQYFWTYGAGLEYDETVLHDLAIRSFAEIREKNFTNAPDRPLSRGLNGHDTLVSLIATKPVTPRSALTLEFDFLNQDTRLAFYGNTTYAISGSYALNWDDPWKITPYPFETTFFLARSWALYDGPDPCCNTSGNPLFFSPSTRHDRRWRFGLTHALVVSPSTAIILQLQRDIVSSNLPIYGYNSNSVIVGPQIHF
jgi:tetratricopeptide (TPR) repeat protein